MDKLQISHDMKSEEFRNYYWTKKELTSFCKLYGIDTSGLKFDVEERIVKFLETRVVEKKISKPKVQNEFILDLDTIIDSSFKRNKVTTDFIKKHCPDFHYTYWMNRYIEENQGNIKLKDLIDFWEEEKIKKKAKIVEKIPQDEYNAFLTIFFNITKKEYTMKEAIKCWHIKKNLKKDMFSNLEDEMEYIIKEAGIKRDE